MRTYLGPIGFNPTSITRPILSYGLDDGDVVTLVRPEDEMDDRRAEETLADVDRTLGALEPDVTTNVERVPHDDFSTAVLACRDLIDGAVGDCILVLGGGARDVLIPLTVAGLAASRCISRTLTYSDIDGAVREIQLPNLTASIPRQSRKTLAIIGAEESIALPEIAEKAGYSKSTVTRHVNQLSDKAAVETWMEGRSKVVKITTTGRLLLKAQTEP